MEGQTVKESLTALIQHAGLTQTSIAAELNCSQANIHYHLNSTAKTPRTTSVFDKRLAKLLGKHRAVLRSAQS